MADYSLVKDQSGDIIGVWLRNPALARDRNFLKALCTEKNLSDGVYAAVYSGSYCIDPNTSDDRGGCFVIWGSTPPGEPPTFEAELARRKKIKRWWQFWK